MQAIRVVGVLLVAGCGATPRPLPEGMKGTCEPPGGTVALSLGPARPDARLRVDVRDLDGADRNATAEGTVTAYVVDPAPTGADGTPAPPAEDRMALALLCVDPAAFAFPEGHRPLADVPLAFGREVALPSSTTAAGYVLSVTCDGNFAATCISVEPTRLVQAQVRLDCTGGWGLPIVSYDYYFPDRHEITR